MIEEPKGEVEIIPPGEDGASSRIWIATGAHSVKVVKLGPFSGLLLALAIGLIMALGLVFLSGVFLILVPVVALLGVGAWLSGLLGGSFRRLR
jgi:hypothetical protein